MKSSAIILFDGVCGLCNWLIQFIIKHDSRNQFKFTSLQSDEGRRLISTHNIAIDTIDSLIVIEESRYLVKSSAAIMIFQQLSRRWSLISLLTIIPVKLRDWGYDWIARNRYQWFGGVNNCDLSPNGINQMHQD